MSRISLTDIKSAGMMGYKPEGEASSSLWSWSVLGRKKKPTLINTHLANQMTQVKDRKMEICFHHPLALFILVIEKICAHISLSFHFVMDYGTLSNLFMGSLFSSAT